MLRMLPRVCCGQMCAHPRLVQLLQGTGRSAMVLTEMLMMMKTHLAGRIVFLSVDILTVLAVVIEDERQAIR